jgi:hypothetical protein
MQMGCFGSISVMDELLGEWLLSMNRINAGNVRNVGASRRRLDPKTERG